MLFLHSTFFNKDFLLDIARKSTKIFTVILKSIMEGSVSQFFDVSLFYFCMLCRREVKIFVFVVLAKFHEYYCTNSSNWTLGIFFSH